MKLPLPILINCYWYLAINEGLSVCMCASSILSTVYPLVYGWGSEQLQCQTLECQNLFWGIHVLNIAKI